MRPKELKVKKLWIVTANTKFSTIAFLPLIFYPHFEAIVEMLKSRKISNLSKLFYFIVESLIISK